MQHTPTNRMRKSLGRNASGMAFLLGLVISALPAQAAHWNANLFSVSGATDLYRAAPETGLFATASRETVFNTPAALPVGPANRGLFLPQPMAMARAPFQVPLVSAANSGAFSDLAHLVSVSSGVTHSSGLGFVSVTASKSDNVAPGAKKQLGDTIDYSVTVGNGTGADDATGVQFSDTLDSNTTLVPSSFKSTPLAYAQAVTTNEDTAKTITLTGIDPDGGALTFSLFGASPTKGALGTITPLTDTTAQVTYTPTADLNGTDSFGFRVTDTDNNTNDDVVTVNITPVNDAPKITAGATLSYTENDAATAIDNTITVSDVDNANLTGASVQITGNYASGEDLLSFTNTANITGSYNSATGTLTLSGTDTVANYQTALRAVKYSNSSNNPSVSARTVSWIVLDGTDPSSAATSTINVTAVNDAPTAALKSGATYAATTNIQISFPASNGLLVDSSDPEGTTLSMDTTPINVTSGAAVTLDSDGGFTVDPPAGVTGTVSFQYRVQDSGTPAPNKFSAYTTVNLNVTGTAIYFVDSTVASAGTGTLARPFKTLAQAATAATASGNRIFLASGSYTGGVTLSSGVLLYGQGVTGSSFDSLMGISPPSGSVTRPSIGGTPPDVTTSAASTNGITVSSGDNTIAGLNIGNTTGSAIASGVSFGTLTISDANIASSGTRTGQALALTSGTLSASFGTLTASSATVGVGLNAVAGTLSATNGSLSGLTGDDVNITGGTVAFTYGGTITNSSGRSINISNKTTSGNVTFNGAITDTGTGISLDNNDGATLNFTGGLTLNTGSNIGFSATNGGTVNVTGTNKIGNVTPLTSSAVKIADTTIGSSGVTFVSLNTNGSSLPGINLSNTGNSGIFTVVGTGSSGTGGAISNSTGSSETSGTPGVRLNNVSNVRLNYMNITGNNHSGIYGTTVNGFKLDSCTISNNGNTVASNPDEVGVDLHDLTGTASAGSNPTSIANCTLSNNYEFQLQVTNSLGTLTDFQLTSNTISSTGAGTIGNLVNFLGTGTSVMKLTATGGSFTGNAPNTATGLFVNSGGTSMTANISSATFTNNNVGIDASTDPVATSLTFNISSNTITGSRSHAINHFNNGNAPYNRTVNGKIVSNNIGSSSTAGSGSVVGDGISVSNEGTVNVNLLINGNDIREIGDSVQHTGARGINVDNGLTTGPTGGGTTALTITGNTITNIYGNRGLIVNQTDYTPGAPAGSAGTVCANISGNTFAGTIAGQAGNGQRMRLKRNVTATSSAFNVTQADVTSLAAANTGVSAAQISSSGSPTYNQPACAQPPLLFSADSQAVVSSSGCGVGISQPAAVASPKASPLLSEANVLTQDKLDGLVEQAISQWEATGLTAEQSAALREMKWTVADLPSFYLGQANGMTFSIDTNAGGNGWFIDATPDQSEEFAGASLLQATTGGAARRHVDALTAVMHEMGHVLGLEDSYLPSDRHSLMYGYLPLNERRFPVAGEAQGALPGTAIGIHRLAGPITMNIGTLPAGKSVTITFSATVNNPTTSTSVSNQGTISGSNFSDVLTDDPDVVGSADATVTQLVANAAPVNTVPAGPLSVAPATNLTVSGISVADSDAGSADITSTLSVGNGKLTVDDTVAGGLTAADITGNGTASVVLTGSQSKLNATLAGTSGLVYKSDGGFSGPDTLTVLTDDGGNTGAGPAQSDTDTVQINVTDSIKPTIAITAPPFQQDLTITTFGPGTINGTVTDNVGVTGVTVKLYRDRNGVRQIWDGTSFTATPSQKNLPATLTDPGTPSATWSYDSSAPTPADLDVGIYYVWAYTQDAAGNTAYTHSEFTLKPVDVTKPVPVIAAPTANQKLLISQFIAGAVHGSATDNVGVVSVDVKLYRDRGTREIWNGTTFGAASVSLPASLSGAATNRSWSFNNVPDQNDLDSGLYNVQVIATDAAGNYGVARVSFTLGTDFTAPTVSISTPAANQKININSFGSGSVTGGASDNIGVDAVKVRLQRKRGSTTEYWNGTAFVLSAAAADADVTTQGGTTVSWTLTNAPTLTDLDAGTYTVYAIASDAVGNTKTSTGRSFTITTTSSSATSINSNGSAGGS